MSLDWAAAFHPSVPDEFLRDTVKAVARAYRESEERCRTERLSAGETLYLRPHCRRAYVERNLRELATRYSGVRGTAELNAARNCYYICLSIGQVILTASHVESPGEVVREAEFRRNLAYSSQTTFGFYKDSQPPATVDTPLYAMLIHGADALDSRLLGFIHVVFPSPDCGSYIGRIDLLKRFPDLSANMRGETTVESPAALLVHLKPVIQEEETS